MTFRGRLLATSMLTLAVGLGALVVAGNAVLRARGDAELASLLRARAEAQIAALDVSSGRIVLRNAANDGVLDRQAWVLDGTRLIERPHGVPAAVDRAAIRLARRAGPGSANTGHDERLRAEPVRARGGRIGTVVVGISGESVERLESSILLGSLVLAALLLLAGWWVTRSTLDGALRPVARMTSEAADWSANDLDRRFELGPARDELTALAATLDALLARIAASRRHEQRFASEVAHELRTPIARMRARGELALRAGTDGDEERVRALETVVAEVDRLTAAVDTLLAVARREADPSSESVDLAAIARETDGVAVEAPAGLPRGEGDADIVRRALAPLVENARRHARERVALVLSTSHGRVRIAVRDDGPGVDPELGDRVFDPGIRGSEHDGAGLGLPLARRLARSCGGEVTIGPGPGGCFVLELPAITPAD